MNGNNSIAILCLMDTINYCDGSDDLEDYDSDDATTTRELVIKLEGTTNKIKVQSTDVGLQVCISSSV